ncbi:MAG: hypothetical protein AB7D06_16150 [Pedobacter sp.]
MKFRTALVVIGIAAMMVGCGKKEDNTVVSGEEGTVTITGEEGTTTMEYGKASLPADMGLTLYPGVTAGPGGTMLVESETEDGTDSVVSVSVHSADDIEKVAQYYKNETKNEQPRIFEMAMPTGKMVTITVEKDRTVKTVVLSENTQQGGTDIQISRIRE